MGVLGGLFGGGKKRGSRRQRNTTRKKAPSKGEKTPAKKEKDPEAGEDAEEIEEIEIDLSEIEEVDETEPVEEDVPAKPKPKVVGPRKPPPKPSEESSSTTVVKPQKPEGGARARIPSGRFRSPGSSQSRRKRSSIAKKLLGNLLVGANSISEQQLEKALAIQEEKGGLLGQILVGMGVCNTANVGSALNKQRTITTVELENVQFDPDALAMVGREQCEQFRLIPFQKIGSMLCVAMSNVLDSAAKNEVREATQAKLKTFDATWPEIQQAIERCYGEQGEPVPPAPGEAPAPSGAAPSEDELELETIEVVDLEEVDDLVIEEEAPPAEVKPTIRPASAASASPSEAPLEAIPVSVSFLRRVTDGGSLSVQERWLAERSTSAALPAEPRLDNGRNGS